MVAYIMRTRYQNSKKPIILSLFRGCGGLDLGFEAVGFETALAFDLRKAAVASHNHNRKHNPAHVADITQLRLENLDKLYGARFDPVGVIGGPPCQSFSRGNSQRSDDDPRSKLVREFFNLALKLHRSRGGLDFIVMENVPEVAKADSGRLLQKEILRLERAGFSVFVEETNAVEFGVAQNRERLMLVALNKSRMRTDWAGLKKMVKQKVVRDAIGVLEEPVQFQEHKVGKRSLVHENHWCMTPKSQKFFDGTFATARSTGRSFKVLDWEKPSYTVSGYRYQKSRHGGKELVRDEPVASIIEEALTGFANGRFHTQVEVQRFLEAQAAFPKDFPNGTIRAFKVTRLLTRPVCRIHCITGLECIIAQRTARTDCVDANI